MPLRDHFRAPIAEIADWESFHAQWPAVIVQDLKKVLPKGFVAAPRTHSASRIEADVAAYEKLESPFPATKPESNGGVATAVWAPGEPTLVVETSFPDVDEYEIRIFNDRRSRRLVAAIEIVSPANKDRPEHRRMFVAKCSALLSQGVAVTIVDLVTVRNNNLYAELVEFIGENDPNIRTVPFAVYAASCRWRTTNDKTILESWYHPLNLGSPLPTLPVWLTDTQAIPLALEDSYERTCEDLSII